MVLSRLEAGAGKQEQQEGGLEVLLDSLGLKQKEGEGARELLARAGQEVKGRAAKAGPALLSKPAISHRLTGGQWQQVESDFYLF